MLKRLHKYNSKLLKVCTLSFTYINIMFKLNILCILVFSAETMFNEKKILINKITKQKIILLIVKTVTKKNTLVIKIIKLEIYLFFY